MQGVQKENKAGWELETGWGAQAHEKSIWVDAGLLIEIRRLRR